MASTPKKMVNWATHDSSIDYGSPFSDATSSDSASSTSSLQYINAQLVAHGFARPPGLSIDGLSYEESGRVVACVMGMLGQRMVRSSCKDRLLSKGALILALQEDLSRTEELTTKLRTLSYDHDRLTSMHRTALERAATAEKEATLHKSRLA